MKFMIAMLSFLVFWHTPDAIQNNEDRFPTKPTQLVEVDLTIKNIRKNKGKVRVGFFKDQTSFEKEIPFKGLNESKESAVNGVLTLKIKLEPGIYGAALMDDENSNGKMDYNFIGIPKEGFGFSNYYHTGFFKPKIYPFQFEVREGKNAKIEIIIQYLL